MRLHDLLKSPNRSTHWRLNDADPHEVTNSYHVKACSRAKVGSGLGRLTNIVPPQHDFQRLFADSAEAARSYHVSFGRVGAIHGGPLAG